MNTFAQARRQAGNSTLYLALAVLVLVGVGIAVYLLSQADKAPKETALPNQDAPLMNVEPPEIKSVDMQETEVDWSPQPSQPSTAERDEVSSENGLFERGGRKIPLQDGLAGGTEAQADAGSETAAPGTGRKLHALDAFDFGVLDGRVRIGVFGKGPIPDYRVTLKQTEYVIDMPGEFRYLDQFGKALQIERFGVSSARLERSPRGMRMRIAVTQGLRHEPFLIEDSKGLMIAFEPRR